MSETGDGIGLAGTAAGNRRLIAIVYADMVSYSHLIGLDDAGTFERLRAFRHTLFDPTIHEFGGRVVQTGGDSLLIAFDSIDGAVRCSVKVQQQVPVHDGDQPPDRRIRFRIGINIGDVIPDGTNLHGEGVNIATRLEAACPVGGICVSRSVRDHVHGRLDLAFEPIGALTLKNIARPVEAFILRLDPGAIAHPLALVTPRSWSRWLKLSLTGGMMLIATSGAAWWWWHVWTVQIATMTPAMTDQADTSLSTSLSKTPRLSIVVLPFVNLSGDPKDNYLVEGMPDDLPPAEAAPLMCAGVTTYNALRESGARAGDLVAILGIGGLGHLGVQFAAKMGFRTVAIARGRDKEALARQLGAHIYMDSQSQNVAAELTRLGGAKTILATVTSGKAMSAVIPGLAVRGKLIVVGVGMDPIQVSAFDLIGGSRSIVGHASGASIDSQDTLAFSALAGVRPTIETMPLERAADAYDKMMRNEARFRMVLTTGL